jgi:thiamine pyrophosphate-dependent acetolactate synthase large subunit-like protein
VVAILGDGGFAMSAMELLTALREEIPLTVIVFNDGQLNLIRLSQLAQWGRPSGVALRNPDFETFAAALGVRFARVQEDSEEVLARAIGSREVWLLEVRLGDSMAIRGLQARGLARGTTERLLGRGALRMMKRWLGR